MHEQPTRRNFVRALGAGTLSLAASGAPALAARRNDAVAKLYDAAKKEGTVVWWTGHYSQGTCERVRDAFRAKYPGIEVQFIRQPGQIVFQRVSQNLKAGVRECDVFASTDEAHYPQLKKLNALAEFRPPDLGNILKQFQNMDPDNAYQLGALGFMLLVYNSKKVTAGAPQKWTDLLDPKWKGQLTIGHPGFSGFVGNWTVAMNDKYGWDYFTKFAANQPKIGRSAFDADTDIVAGERMAGGAPDNLSFERHAAGDPINVVFPQDDAILVVSPVAVLKDAPHPNAARLFMNFYYTREYSEVMIKQFNPPLVADMPTLTGERLEKIKSYRVKSERLAVAVPEVIAKWRETFGV